MGAFSDLFDRLDPDPRVRGKQFEHVCKWFLTNDPLYKQRLRHVWMWKEWPDRWSDAEAGIDLVAEDTNGHLWAVQAKAYADGKPIPKRELNKFLAESNVDQFHQRLLIATTDQLHGIAQRTVNAQKKDVTFVGLSDLRAADEYLVWPVSPDHLRPSPPSKPSKPHDYQRDAIKDVVKAFSSADRGQLIMACGTGKTLTSLFIKEKLAADRTLILVPSLSLLKQTMRVWYAHRRDEFATLPVCSDATVSRDEDAIVERTSDLGVPVTTDPAEIAAFLRRLGPRVVFATYQSSPQVAKAYELGRVPAFDLVIADEAHRCAGPVSSDFATVLDAGKIRAKRRLFMTATPRVYSESTKRAAKDENFEYASMDDWEKFGEVFHKLGFSQAIERKLLTDYRVAVIGVDDATYREWAERGTFVTLDGKTPTSARKVAGQIGVAKAMGEYDLRRTISFHSYVSRASDFAASMVKVIAWMPAAQRPTGTLWARYASGDMDAGQRSRLIHRLADLKDEERGLLSNARCLAEGVDVPTLDGVAFIDPRRSEVDIVQAVGRAIRKADNKKTGTIVIPVFIDTATDAESALESSVFKPVWDVIRALRSHDEELGRQLDELRRELGRHGGKPRLPPKIHVDIPKKVDAAFAEAFKVRLVEQTTTSWEFWFGLLQKFVEQHSHARVPRSCTIDGHRLGAWVNGQRNKYTSGILDMDRRSRLQDLPGWSWDFHRDQWDEGFHQLLDYVDRHGHSRVPVSYKADGYGLGAWVNVQRDKFAQGLLNDDRRARLETLSGWAWNALDVQWEEGFTNLLAYIEVHGNACVPQSYKVGGHDLGNWVSIQRVRYAKRTLDPRRRERLEELPSWTWRATDYDRAWEEGFRRLRDYIEHHGDSLVPQSYVVDGYKLGSWVTVQRHKHAKGTLDPEREHRLANLPGWFWDARAAQWEQGFRRLQEYVECHGHALVPQNYVIDAFKLGKWVNTQRVFRRENRLDTERLHRLEAQPRWSWDSRQAKWEEGFRHLQRYAEEHGHARVPQSYIVDGFRLGNWVNMQRSNFANNILDDDRRLRLEGLSGWSWPRREHGAVL